MLLRELSGRALLATKMMYAAGFRIGELGRLRIKDIDFKRRQINVQNSKHGKSRVVGFPESLHDEVGRQVESMRVLWKHDAAEGLNGVSLPYAWGRKSPRSHLDFAWWYLFAADDYSRCPTSGRLLRHHCDMGNIGRMIGQGARRAGIPKRITAHCLRHSWVTHSLEGNVPAHVVQALAGHDSLETTTGYAHMAKDGPTSAVSPLDTLKQLLANPSMTQAKQPPKEEPPPQLRIYAG